MRIQTCVDIGVNISEQTSGRIGTNKREKQESTHQYETTFTAHDEMHTKAPSSILCRRHCPIGFS